MDLLTGWDYFVGLVLLLSLGFGVVRGLIRTVFAFAAWVIAFFGTNLFSPELMRIGNLAEHPWVVVIVLFVALFLLVRVAGRLLARGVKAVGLGGVDRLLGAGIGVLRALFVIAVAVAGARMLGLNQDAGWQQALSRPLLEHTLRVVEPYLPAQVTGIRQA